MDDLKAGKSQLEAIIQEIQPSADRAMPGARCEGRLSKDKILEMAKLPAGRRAGIRLSHRPDITTYLLGSNAAAVVVRHAEWSVLVVR